MRIAIPEIVGHLVRWEFSDGPVPGQTFEHVFNHDGTVTHRTAAAPEYTTEQHYECIQVGHSVFAVTYLASTGWTLTSLLDVDTGTLVSFASNEKELVVSHGTFVVVPQIAA